MTYYRVRFGKHDPINPFECEIYCGDKARALHLFELYKNYIRTHFLIESIQTDTPDWFIYSIASSKGDFEWEIECNLVPYNTLIGFVQSDIIPEHLKGIFQ